MAPASLIWSSRGTAAKWACNAKLGAELKRFVPPGSPGEGGMGEKEEGDAEELHSKLSVSERAEQSLSLCN